MHSIRHNEKVAIFYTAIYIGSSKKDAIEQKPDLRSYRFFENDVTTKSEVYKVYYI